MSVDTEPLLNWPPNLGRSKTQRPGTFRTSFAAAYQHVLAELKRMRVPKATVSGNLAVNRSGHASAEQLKSGDVGIALHFTYGGELFVIADDQYTTREANMARTFYATTRLTPELWRRPVAPGSGGMHRAGGKRRRFRGWQKN